MAFLRFTYNSSSSTSLPSKCSMVSLSTMVFLIYASKDTILFWGFASCHFLLSIFASNCSILASNSLFKGSHVFKNLYLDIKNAKNNNNGLISSLSMGLLTQFLQRFVCGLQQNLLTDLSTEGSCMLTKIDLFKKLTHILQSAIFSMWCMQDYVSIMSLPLYFVLRMSSCALVFPRV